MKVFVACFLILFNNLPTSFSQNPSYCNTAIYGRFAEQGTLCRYSPTQVGSACGNPGNHNTNFVFDVQTRDFIVNRHNELRRRVAMGLETRGLTGRQPAASRMMKIEWSRDLAAAAQAWANQCQFKADANRNESTLVVRSETSNPVYVGQNMYGYIVRSFLYDRNTTVLYWDQAINSWYNEVDVFNPSVVPSYTYQLRAGHYTQMVAASTRLIGCGFMSWGLSRDRVARVHVCNYGPGGNIPGQPIYNTTNGAGCTIATATSPSTCPSDTSCINGLCRP